jgi:hypothetical protein
MPSLHEPPVQAGADDIHAHPRHTGTRWFDLALALSAIFISAVSLFVAIEHGRTERDLVAASSWPFIRELMDNEYDAGDGTTRFAAIGISNGGVGPAKLESFEVFYRSVPMGSGLGMLRRCCGLGPTADDVKRQLPHGIRYSLTDHTVVRPGEAYATFAVPRSTEVGDRFAAAFPDITLRGCYCSILDQCFISNLKDTRTTPVKACPEPAVQFSPNRD